VLDAYRKANDSQDVAYWYNERATLSTLAGALWLSGGLVLEEYCTTRGSDGPDSGAGRTDLWCRLEGAEYTVEAKQHPKASYPALPRSLGPWATVQLAWASAQCLTDDFGAEKRLAMVFMVPSLLAAPSADALDEWIQAISSFPADLKAHYLGADAPQSPRNHRYFPGVILLGRMVPSPS
jgi:hypothetical protein